MYQIAPILGYLLLRSFSVMDIFCYVVEKVCDMVTLSKTKHGGLVPGLMVDQHEALADTTELTDTVYSIHPTQIQTVNPWISRQQHCIFPQGYQVLLLRVTSPKLIFYSGPCFPVLLEQQMCFLMKHLLLSSLLNQEWHHCWSDNHNNRNYSTVDRVKIGNISCILSILWAEGCLRDIEGGIDKH